MRSTNIKKGIAFALSALMLFGTVPQAAFAIDDGSKEPLVESTATDEDKNAVKDSEGNDSEDEKESEQPSGSSTLYNIYISDVANGTILVNGSEDDIQVAAGETVTLQANPDEGYELTHFYGIDDNDEIVWFEQNGEAYTLVMPQSDLTVDAIFSKVETQEAEKETEQAVDKEEACDDVWLSRSVQEIEEMVGVKSDTPEIMLLSSASVTGYISGNFYGGPTASLSLSDGTLAYCILPWAAVPEGGSADFADYSVSSSIDANLQLMAKIMYYGYGGGGNILTDRSAFEQEAITHFALSYIWMVNLGNSYTIPNPWYTGGGTVNEEGQAIIMNFIYTVQTKPNVKGDLHIASYYQQSGTEYQDIVYGTFTPEVEEGYLKLHKSSNCPNITDGNSLYSLAGAVYGVYSDSACTDQKATLTTNANGDTDSVKLIVGTYYVKEVTAPKGYMLNTNVSKVTVTTANTSSNPVVLSVSDEAYNDPVGILLQKIDIETGKKVESLAGAQYTVKYYDVKYKSAIAGATPQKTWVFETDKNGIIKLDSNYKVSGDDFYKTSTGSVTLPLGYITIQETKAPAAYLLDDTIYVCNTAMVDSRIRTTNLPIDKDAVNESPKRGDFDFTKVSQSTGAPLSGVPFKITNDETGESHVIVTDENGYASTASSHNSHSKNTNRGQNSKDGVWFGELSAIDDEKGALPYGTYTVTELESDANYGMDLVSFSVSISKNNVTVHKGNVKNSIIDLSTTALSATTGIKTMPVGTSEKLTDTVSYTNLTIGSKYNLKASVVDKETKKVVATGEKTFTPKAASGSVKITMTLDTTKLEGKTLVVFEELYQGDSKRQDHTSLADTEQTVYVPKIATTAIDSKTYDHVGAVDKETIIVDIVDHQGLQAGIEYKLTGKLMDQTTGKTIIVNGKEVTAEKTFTPSTTNGREEIDLTFDTTSIAGKSVVVFETISYDGITLCTHADIADTNQTVNFPSVDTEAKDVLTGDNQAVADKEATLLDTVNYKNLTVGEEYTIKGMLMDKETGEVLLVNDETITDEVTFTADKKGGTAEMKFTFDSLTVKGKTVVVFEELYHNDILVASHVDISDENQSVHIPKMWTSAIDDDTKDEVGTEVEESTIVDTVSYENLIAGKEYTVKGKLMNQATNEPLLINNEEVVAETTFVPDSADGTVDVVFVFDSSALAGQTVVVFEDLYHNNVNIYTHADIDDKEQSIYYPEIHTAAIDGDTLDRVGTVQETATVTDTVSYNNLVVGKEYTIKGVLMDQATNEPLLINDEEIVSEATFVAEETEGNIDLEFTLDSTMLKGTSIVVFEELFHNDVNVTSHTDIDDIDQTVEYPEITTEAIDSKTKDDQGVAGEEETIVDTVSYKNLIVGEEYTIKGMLMDKETGEVLLVNDEEVTAKNTFTAEEKNGTVEMEFTFDSLAVKGKTVVVFEELYHNDILVASHTDIEDENQDVFVPEMHTTAIDKDTKAHVGKADEKATIIDTVSYSNLIVGNEYTIKGILMDKETKEALKVNGKEVVAEVTFTAKEAKGEIELTYELDASALAGKTVVVFEDLYYKDVVVYSHADIEDKDQSIYYPEIKTVATINGGKEVTVSNNITVSDKISYKNLVVGETYTIKGVLMDKATGNGIIANKKEVTAETTFKAEKTDGEITMDFTFDASALGGHTVVVFEELYYNDILVTAHKDINDAEQTVKLNAVPVTPPTGDNSSMVLWMSILGISVLATSILFYKRRKSVK